MDCRVNDEEFFSIVNEMFSEKIPFNKVLGIKVELIGPDRVKTSFGMRDELMGNYERGMLHGGVISSVIDATGGLAAFMSIQEKMRGKALEARFEISGRISTIDLRVDFLRPGLGKRFVATAYTLRTGNKVVVTRIELHNDRNDLIAVGTGSYLVA
ncbi:MAG: thioesterase family protein [Syntrophorhabdus aromaticivorans]|uniref:Medium/long-chain acyl-CoA thioesterase YigI n=1 Tax=Syntrophorhabdus aromaticivorans TaxID=328301 RepID=A0A971S2N2_9BACT|nr:thioesterase family protein [Syntrophorhabdus aromaticivorans]